MNATEFRKHKRLVSGFGKIKETPVWKDVWRVMWEEHPMYKPQERSVGVQRDESSYQLGTIDGANRMLKLLEALSRPSSEPEELKATYSPPES